MFYIIYIINIKTCKYVHVYHNVGNVSAAIQHTKLADLTSWARPSGNFLARSLLDCG
jgi:hypothetical protein